jgi:hypothetical protein
MWLATLVHINFAPLNTHECTITPSISFNGSCLMSCGISNYFIISHHSRLRNFVVLHFPSIFKWDATCHVKCMVVGLAKFLVGRSQGYSSFFCWHKLRHSTFLDFYMHASKVYTTRLQKVGSPFHMETCTNFSIIKWF